MTPAPAGRWLDVLAWAAIVAFLGTISMGILVPLYVDEVATKIVQARFLAEDGQMVSLFPQCGSGFVLGTPVTWYPAAALFAVIYAHLPPVGLRLAGIGVFLAWLAAFAGWVFQSSPAGRHRLHTAAAVTALLGLGVLPLTMILARPEQWLVLVLTCFLLLAAGADRWTSGRGAWAPAALFVGFLLLTSLLNYAHPKALFFLPFVVMAAYAVFGPRRKLLVGVAAVFAVASAYQTFSFAGAVSRCEDAPILARILGAQTTKVSLIATDPVALVTEAVANLASAPGEIADQVVFQSAYQSAWLPPVPFAADGPFVRTVNASMRGFWYLACLLAVLLPPLVFFLRAREDDPRGSRLLFPALWVGLVGHLALYKEWNFYGGSLVIAMAGVLLVHASGRLRTVARPAWLASAALASLLALMLASTGVLAMQLGPRLLKAARSADEIPSSQMNSVNAFAYAPVRERIRALAEECGIEGDGANRLVIDDLSYFAFSGLHQPIHLSFLWPGGWGADVAGKTRDLLVSLRSDGMIARCSLFGPEFRYQTLPEGNLCCVDLKDKGFY